MKQGNYNFSKLLGAWAGNAPRAAGGVPDRFLNPDAPGPKKPKADDGAEASFKADDGEATKVEGGEAAKVDSATASEEVKA